MRSRLHRYVAAPDTDGGTADRVAHAALRGQVRLHTGQEGGGGGAAKHRRLDTRHQGQNYSKKRDSLNDISWLESSHVRKKWCEETPKYGVILLDTCD